MLSVRQLCVKIDGVGGRDGRVLPPEGWGLQLVSRTFGDRVPEKHTSITRTTEGKDQRELTGRLVLEIGREANCRTPAARKVEVVVRENCSRRPEHTGTVDLSPLAFWS